MQQKHQNLEHKWNTACSWMYHLMFLGQDFSTINGRIQKSQISRSCTKMILIHVVFSLSGSNQQILPPDKGLLTAFNRLNVYYNGRFQKISILYHGRLLGFPKGRGGFTIMEFWGHGGGIYDWKSEGMGKFHRLGISGVESVEWVPWKHYCCGLL